MIESALSDADGEIILMIYTSYGYQLSNTNRPIFYAGHQIYFPIKAERVLTKFSLLRNVNNAEQLICGRFWLSDDHVGKLLGDCDDPVEMIRLVQ